MARLTFTKRTQASTAEASPPVKPEEVAEVAYELFEQRGRTHGQDQQDWFEAEHVLRQRRQQKSRR